LHSLTGGINSTETYEAVADEIDSVRVAGEAMAKSVSVDAIILDAWQDHP
jgi:hypothetical protein